MLIYLHGFRSSPLSAKSRLLARRMREIGRGDRFACPQLPASPLEAVRLIGTMYDPQPEDTLVGSSLGGYYATFLAERHGCRAVLLNPAVEPARDLASHVGTQQAYHSNESFEFREQHLEELRLLEIDVVTFPQRYLLIAAKGDELLDWREMVARYPSARRIVLEGGDHGLTDFEPLVDEVLRFAGLIDDKDQGGHEVA